MTMLRILLAISSLLLGGCASAIRSTSMLFPPIDSASFQSIDGTLLHPTAPPIVTVDRCALTFVTGGSPAAPYSELIGFWYTGAPLSRSALLSSISAARNLDPKFEYDIQDLDDGSILLAYHSPQLNEHGLTKVSPYNGGSLAVFYQNRMGSSGSSKMVLWLRLMRKTNFECHWTFSKSGTGEVLPNQTLQPTPL
jgi:hypothetical protein